jgi:bifunctional DNA-binding transcriptional regulator/antitoxin component of YhaV-PrlF toxin-antitoxin module
MKRFMMHTILSPRSGFRHTIRPAARRSEHGAWRLPHTCYREDGITMTVAVKNNNKAPLVVPAAVRRRTRFKSGQELEFRDSGGVITIVPMLPSAEDEYTPKQRRIIDAQLAEGLAETKAGRLRGPFSTHEEFIASLHKEARKLSRKKTKR